MAHYKQPSDQKFNLQFSSVSLLLLPDCWLLPSMFSLLCPPIAWGNEFPPSCKILGEDPFPTTGQDPYFLTCCHLNVVPSFTDTMSMGSQALPPP